MYKKGLMKLMALVMLFNAMVHPNISLLVHAESPSELPNEMIFEMVQEFEEDKLDIKVRSCLDEEIPVPVIYDFEDEHDDSIHEVVEDVTDEVDSELEEENNIKFNNYTEDDLYILAHIICGEGQYCDVQEQKYIGSVFLNRVNSPAFPDTFREVAFQKKQYACTWDGNFNKEPTEENWEVARWLLENGSVLPEKVVFQAQFEQGVGTYIKTKYHYYCFMK